MCWPSRRCSPEQRAADPRTCAKKLHVMESPFDPQDRVVLVPAIHTEFAVLHVQKATANGIVRIEGQTFADVQQALCADTVIVTAEEIVDEDACAESRSANHSPIFAVKHVCHVPWGAHPYAVYNYYDYDPRQLKPTTTVAEDDAAICPVPGEIRLRGEGPRAVSGSGGRFGTAGWVAVCPCIRLPAGPKAAEVGR